MIIKGKGDTPAAKANSPTIRSTTGTQPGTEHPLSWTMITTASPANDSTDMNDVVAKITC